MRLDEICTEIVDCEHKTAPITIGGGFYAVGTPAMQKNTIDFSQAREIDENTFWNWTKRLTPEFGDLLFAREAPVGPIVQIPPTLNVAPGQRTVLLRPNPSRADTHFVYYAILNPRTQQQVLDLAMGSTVPHLNVADVRALHLQLPPLWEQQAIAEVLGALDDKIAANSRLDSTAHELASALHARTLRDVEVEATYAEIAAVGGGATPSTRTEEYWGGTVRWAVPSDVTALSGPYLDDTSRRITEAGLAACSSPLYPEGSILMTSRATIGAFAVNLVPTAVNQGFIVVKPHEEAMKWWLFHEMQRRVPEYVNRANGATFLELPRSVFKSMTLGLPPREVIQSFADHAGPLHDRAIGAMRESARLAQLRDTILPALMDGRLRVRDAVKQVEGVL